jgi:hypothetical protein
MDFLFVNEYHIGSKHFGEQPFPGIKTGMKERDRVPSLL